MKTAIPTQAHEAVSANVGAQYRWENVSEAGAYYSNWSGHLLRVPEYALKDGFSPLIDIRGKEPMLVTKLSDDPFVCLSKARSIAANLDLAVNF
ncbi:MAG: hypothetical protein HOP15_16655 [Planctomycetes bacterium]|nr:hypothetical protein [Planctomycetota bacterium]